MLFLCVRISRSTGDSCLLFFLCLQLDLGLDFSHDRHKLARLITCKVLADSDLLHQSLIMLRNYIGEHGFIASRAQSTQFEEPWAELFIDSE